VWCWSKMLSSPQVASAIVMRVPRITTITTQSYANDLWPKIYAQVTDILMAPEKPRLQEELYRLVYNVCCQRHQFQLYNDLMRVVKEHVTLVRQKLLSATEETFLFIFAHAFVDYCRSVDVLCVGFRYLERVYIVEKCQDTLTMILHKTFSAWILEPSTEPPDIKQRLQATLERLKPPISDPSIMMQLVKGLYALGKEYTSFNPSLFAMYIPCLQPSRGIETDQQEALSHLHLLRSSGLPRGNCRLKRKHQDMLTL